MTNIYIVDEHHEVYLAWWKGLKNTHGTHRHLIHIDEHADMGIPALNEKIPDVNEPFLSQSKFVYQNLSVGTFLIPAYISKFFSTLSWIKPSSSTEIESVTLEFSASDEAPYILSNEKEAMLDNPKTHKTIWEITPKHESWMLDICLDAFACLPYPQANNLELEISFEQFTLLNLEKLNPWKARYGNLFITNHCDGKYFAKLLPYQPQNIANNFMEIDYISRLNKFSIWLKGLNFCPPGVVTVSRSIISGYTSPELAPIIEKKLMFILEEFFPHAKQIKL
jgi:hypothetical protein